MLYGTDDVNAERHIRLWLHNDAEIYAEFVENARELAALSDDETVDVYDAWGPEHALSVLLRHKFKSDACSNLRGAALDIMNAALSTVDWVEIAVDFMAELGL